MAVRVAVVGVGVHETFRVRVIVGMRVWMIVLMAMGRNSYRRDGNGYSHCSFVVMMRLVSMPVTMVVLV